jgi:hypothetical protein
MNESIGIGLDDPGGKILPGWALVELGRSIYERTWDQSAAPRHAV